MVGCRPAQGRWGRSCDCPVCVPFPPPNPHQISAVWHGTLVKLLRSLYALALPAACRELRSVEQEVRWRLRRLKYRQLAFLAESSATHMQESPELLAELLLHLERRWTEIDDGRTAVALMAKTGHLSEPLMNRLEDKVLRQEPWAAAGAPRGHTVDLAGGGPS